MKLALWVRNRAWALLQIYGTRRTKKALWDTEFAGGKWACLDETSGDIVYPIIDEWAHGGSILDLGCGSGNTANELRPGAYQSYTGVDISSVALERAKARCTSNDRFDMVRFVQSDVLTYIPTEEFNVILFRESIYYIATNKIRSLLMRYAKYLGEKGVFIVRVWNTSGRYKRIVDLIEKHFEIIETKASPRSSSFVMVFRP